MGIIDSFGKALPIIRTEPVAALTLVALGFGAGMFTQSTLIPIWKHLSAPVAATAASPPTEPVVASRPSTDRPTRSERAGTAALPKSTPPSNGSVAVGSVTSVNQSGGVTAGQIDSVTQ